MKIIYFLLFLMTLSLASCSERPINEKVLPVVEKIFGKPTITDHYEKHLFYIFAVPDTEVSKYKTAKDAIDKCLNMLPTEHDRGAYKWETPQYKIIWDIYQKSNEEKFYNRLQIILK